MANQSNTRCGPDRCACHIRVPCACARVDIYITGDVSQLWCGVQVVDALATWWRPNFEDKMFPYQPVHVSYPKESTKIFLVGLSGLGALAVPKSFELRAV
jgi:hypothetical protein